MTELITDRYPYEDKTLTEYSGADHEAIRALLLGRKVEKIADDHLRLDDGTVMRIDGNEGCGGCGSGWYDLTDLNEVDNVITAVRFDDHPADDYDGGEGYYEIYVMAEHKLMRLMRVEGTDGNGYYGTGYRIWVRKGAALQGDS